MSLARLAAPAAILAAALATACGSDQRAGSEARARSTAPTHAPSVRIPRGPGHLAVMAPKDGLTVRSRPNGGVIAHLKRRTRWGSPTVVWGIRRRGNWLAVVAPGLANNRPGWIDVSREQPRMWRSRLSLHADLSARTLELRDGRRIRRRMTVTIGGPSSPTPAGRFAVTDKLVPAPSQTYYGCCILALSGTQPKLRPGWAGGDRIAIHGSPSGTVGTAASAGCLRARNADLRALMEVVPVGTPVVIRA